VLAAMFYTHPYLLYCNNAKLVSGLSEILKNSLCVLLECIWGACGYDYTLDKSFFPCCVYANVKITVTSEWK